MDYVYKFWKNETKGTKDMKDLLGGKGANLCEMARMGLPVPPGLTITTEVCDRFNKNGGVLPECVVMELKNAVHDLEKYTGKFFGDVENPLLFSSRSGAKVSMPGMLNTVLNLGLNDRIVEGLSRRYGEKFAYDCYRRLLDMFGDVVYEIPHDDFEEAIAEIKEREGIKFDVEMSAENLKELVARYKGIYAKYDKVFPEDPWEQLMLSVEAVFKSWNIPRAVKYREINKITGLKGTAVNVQTMVYGNLNDNSGTGVCFSRNAATGEKGLYGEFLMNAQGEDVVAGIRTPIPIAGLKEVMPTMYDELEETILRIERHMCDMQDTEFTIENGRLYMLQTRNGKRTGRAALKITLDLVKEGMVSKEKAITMVEPRHLDQLLHPTFDNLGKMEVDCIATGLAASPGAAVGAVVFDSVVAEEEVKKGNKIVLCRVETSPEDIGGMHVAEGVLTTRGGMTSHAAVVARGWGKPCVCGCEALQIDYVNKTVTVDSVVYKEGDVMSIDGGTGKVYRGAHAVKAPGVVGDLGEFMGWVDEVRRMDVYANADTPEDALIARSNGAVGVGLCRTEHMFFSSKERIFQVRRMIAASLIGDAVAMADSLGKLQKYQQEDFEGIFEAMNGLPVTIRLLDPPLHEFLPSGVELRAFCKSVGMGDPDKLMERLESLHESNPMMGLRGCRLGIVYPDITKMQTHAILGAADAFKKKGVVVKPHIMIPLVSMENELKAQLSVVKSIAEEYPDVAVSVGTMIETPRGALQAHTLALHAEFFSFGTNDLTQMTFGISRDDAELKFLSLYKRHGIIEQDPFETIDQSGVGELIRMACERGKQIRPSLSLGVCGEHGADPDSIRLFERVGLDYVSCSPLRVPIARLACALATLAQR